MTPDNDKTLRGIFRGVNKGFDEWNDRRDYRTKYETEFYIGQSLCLTDRLRDLEFAIVPSLDRERRGVTILDEHERNRSVEDDEHYLWNLDRLFPESRIVRHFKFMMTFGMCRDLDGKFSHCDCCGTPLHALNCGGNYGMCDDCEENHRKNTETKDFDLTN